MRRGNTKHQQTAYGCVEQTVLRAIRDYKVERRLPISSTHTLEGTKIQCEDLLLTTPEVRELLNISHEKFEKKKPAPQFNGPVKIVEREKEYQLWTPESVQRAEKPIVLQRPAYQGKEEENPLFYRLNHLLANERRRIEEQAELSGKAAKAILKYVDGKAKGYAVTRFIPRDELTSIVKELVALEHEEEEVANKLVQKNTPLVYSTAKRTLGRLPDEDLAQEGMTGLWVSIRTYHGGFKFSTYATWWIRQYILRALHNNTLVHLPAHLQEALAVIRKYEREHGQQPTRDYVTEKTGFAKDIINSVYTFRKIVHLDRIIANEENATLHYFVPDTKARPPEELIHEAPNTDQIKKAFSALSRRERQIIAARYGIGREEASLESIAQELNLTRSGLREIESRAIRKVKDYFRNL